MKSIRHLRWSAPLVVWILASAPVHRAADTLPATISDQDFWRMITEFSVPLVGDFAGPRVLRSIGKYLKEREAIVTAFYVSNVERYLAGQQWQAFYSNVATLPLDASSVFIRFVDTDFTPFLERLNPPRDVQTGLIPMLELVDLANAGRLPSYPEVLRRQKALP